MSIKKSYQIRILRIYFFGYTYVLYSPDTSSYRVRLYKAKSRLGFWYCIFHRSNCRGLTRWTVEWLNGQSSCVVFFCSAYTIFPVVLVCIFYARVRACCFRCGTFDQLRSLAYAKRVYGYGGYTGKIASARYARSRAFLSMVTFRARNRGTARREKGRDLRNVIHSDVFPYRGFLIVVTGKACVTAEIARAIDLVPRYRRETNTSPSLPPVSLPRRTRAAFLTGSLTDRATGSLQLNARSPRFDTRFVSRAKLRPARSHLYINLSNSKHAYIHIFMCPVSYLRQCDTAVNYWNTIIPSVHESSVLSVSSQS